MYQRKDSFYARAKAAGYRSRAAYKLIELAQRYQLIRRGDHVVDLGAWPGGWLQVAAQLVGERGIVAGVDLVPIEKLPDATVRYVVGDVTDPRVRDEVRRQTGGRVDVVLSDMAPKLSGVRATDVARAERLAQSAIDFAQGCLVPGGRLLMKVFSGPETDALVPALRRIFTTVKQTRPTASRKGSSELYLIALGYRPGPAA